MSIFLKTGRVRSEWTDYNGHMNLAYYIHLFDGAWEILLGKFNIGEEAAKNEKRTTFAVESHTTYDQELKVGDTVVAPSGEADIVSAITSDTAAVISSMTASEGKFIRQRALLKAQEKTVAISPTPRDFI